MEEKTRDLPLNGEVAIITGAANGIGRGIALAMAAAGASIVVSDIDILAGPETYREIDAKGHRGLFVETDVRKDADLDRLVDETLKTFGRIDLLVNDAGINAPGGFLGVSREDLRSVFDTDLIGPFILTQRVAREMIRMAIRGRIVCISSIHSVVAHYHPYYSAAKIGLERLVMDAALELGPYGIRINGIRPGGIHIRGNMELNSPEIASPEVPLGKRQGLPAEIADLALFLVSDASRYITGTTVTIDGGLSMLSYSAMRSRENVLNEQSQRGIPAPVEAEPLVVKVVQK